MPWFSQLQSSIDGYSGYASPMEGDQSSGNRSTHSSVVVFWQP